jgi:hypothetical protein
MQNLTVHLGSATPLSSSNLSEQRRAARARRILVTADRDTVGAPPARRGQAPRHRPAPRGTSAAGPPLSFLSLSAALTTAPLKRDRAHSSSRLHSSPSPPLERPSLPTTPHTRTVASSHRQPPLPRRFRPSTAAVRHSSVSSSPSCQSLQFLAIFSPPCLSGAAGPHTRRRHPPELPPHRRTPPPDAVCAASPSARRSGAPLPLLLAATFPVTPSRSPATPCRRRAVGEHATAPSHARSACGDRAGACAQQAAHASCPAGMGCQAVAQPAFRPTARGRPPRPVGSSLRPVSARYCAWDFKYFSNCFK